MGVKMSGFRYGRFSRSDERAYEYAEEDRQELKRLHTNGYKDGLRAAKTLAETLLVEHTGSEGLIRFLAALTTKLEE